MATVTVPDPLPLRTITVPPEVTAVAGCDCGGLDWHRTDCTIRTLPFEIAQAAIDAANKQCQAFTDGLNERLRDRG